MTAANAQLDHFAATYKWISLHTADPGNTGLHEIVGSPYVRLQVTWPTAAGGLLEWIGALAFSIPSALTVTYFGIWSAQTGGSWGDAQLLPAPRTFTGPGSYVLSRLALAVSPYTHAL